MKTPNLFTRFAREAARMLRNFRYEMDPSRGIVFPQAKVSMGGVFYSRVRSPGGLYTPWAADHNRVVTQGLVDILNVYLVGSGQTGAFYVAPFSGAVTPASTWTAANFSTNATEFLAYTTGVRQQWVPDGAASATPSIGNINSPAQYTFSAGGPYAVRGAGLLSSSAQSSTAGNLIAATRFAADYTGLNAGSELAIKYVFSAVDIEDV